MDITPRRQNIQQEETAPGAAVAEAVLSRVGAGINFINTAHYEQHNWNLNGQYNIVTPPNLAIDGYLTYPWAYTIDFVQMFTGDVQGSSGLTEVDLKWASDSGTSFVSIFSTTPKFTYQASPDDHIRNGLTKTFWTTPVLSKTSFDPWDRIRLDLLQAVGGEPNGLFVKLWIRPTNLS